MSPAAKLKLIDNSGDGVYDVAMVRENTIAKVERVNIYDSMLYLQSNLESGINSIDFKPKKSRITTVSYTHLDVYKRQIPGRSFFGVIETCSVECLPAQPLSSRILKAPVKSPVTSVTNSNSFLVILFIAISLPSCAKTAFFLVCKKLRQNAPFLTLRHNCATA